MHGWLLSPLGMEERVCERVCEQVVTYKSPTTTSTSSMLRPGPLQLFDTSTLSQRTSEVASAV